MSGIPRWVMLLLAAALIAFGIAASQGWIRDPSLAKADYLGTTGVSAEEAKLYVPVSNLHLIGRYSGASPDAVLEAERPANAVVDRALAWLGRYYAAKIRGACALACRAPTA